MTTGSEVKGWVFDIQRYSINDGPGIRTTVFMKGCALHCLWCSNPESQVPLPQLLYFEQRCTRCYRCLASCPTGATFKQPDGAIKVERDKCTACGKCVEACLSEARVVSGKLMTVREVFAVVKKDSLFYTNSGGGATASGGEPFYQPEFLRDLFRLCQEHGIHTAVETSGQASWKTIEGVLDLIDLFLYDIKHVDPEKHRRLAGTDNVLILENLAKLARRGKEIVLRAPIIPGCNDDPDELRSLARLAAELGIKRVDIIPYHRLGERKYDRLGRHYEMAGVAQYREDAAEEIKKTLESHGLDVRIA